MKFNKIFAVIFTLVCFVITTPILAQSGGRKKEHRNQRGGGGLFKRKKSGGHADSFAKGGKGGFFSRIFKSKKSGGAWVYHKTNPGTKQNREQSRLFKRFRTKNKRYTDGVLANQNKKREGRRGSNFNKKKR
jgi:hypothetical protein